MKQENDAHGGDKMSTLASFYLGLYKLLHVRAEVIQL